MPSASGINVSVSLFKKSYSTQTHKDHKWVSCKEYSSSTTKQVLDCDNSLKIHKTHIPIKHDQYYSINLDQFCHPFTNIIYNVVIDGVDQGCWIAKKSWRGVKTTISYRRISTTQGRYFQFKALEVTDDASNYTIDEDAHADNGFIRRAKLRGDFDPISFMYGKNAAGTIRVNLIKGVGPVKNVGIFQGSGDYKPCGKVDEIGQMKINDVKTVTGLSKATDVPTSKCVSCDVAQYPYESFVFHYSTHEDMAAQNLLVDNKGVVATFFSSMFSIFKPSNYKNVKASKASNAFKSAKTEFSEKT